MELLNGWPHFVMKLTLPSGLVVWQEWMRDYPGRLSREHLRLGSTPILSRTFHRASRTIKELRSTNFEAEVHRLRKTKNLLEKRSDSQNKTDHTVYILHV